jgi:high-affinity nickel-transport protein
VLTLLPVVALGFFLGVRHATDPDHVVAVGTIVSAERRAGSAAMIGALWGIGHTVTMLLAGGAIVGFGLVVPPRVGLTVELSVALMLIVLGALGIAGAGRPAPARPLDRLDRRLGGLGLYHVVRPLVVGAVHGVAGSAAVGLLVVATIGDPLGSLIYLLVFGLGTVAGMMVITTAIALPFVYTARRLLGVNRSLAVATGVLSVGLGLFLVYQIGFVGGLFIARS